MIRTCLSKLFVFAHHPGTRCVTYCIALRFNLAKRAPAILPVVLEPEMTKISKWGWNRAASTAEVFNTTKRTLDTLGPANKA